MAAELGAHVRGEHTGRTGSGLQVAADRVVRCHSPEPLLHRHHDLADERGGALGQLGDGRGWVELDGHGASSVGKKATVAA